MALGPGEVDNQLIIVTAAGEMKFIDFRMTTGQASAAAAGEGHPPFSSSSARMGVWKTVQPDDKGPLCAVAGHPYAPLLATSSLSPQSQVRSTERKQLIYSFIHLISCLWEKVCGLKPPFHLICKA